MQTTTKKQRAEAHLLRNLLRAQQQIQNQLNTSTDPNMFYPIAFDTAGHFLGNSVEGFIIRSENHTKIKVSKRGDYIEDKTEATVEIKVSKACVSGKESSFNFYGIKTSNEGHYIDEYRLVTLEKVNKMGQDYIVVTQYALSPKQMKKELFASEFVKKKKEEGYTLSIQNSLCGRLKDFLKYQTSQEEYKTL